MKWWINKDKQLSREWRFWYLQAITSIKEVIWSSLKQIWGPTDTAGQQKVMFTVCQGKEIKWAFYSKDINFFVSGACFCAGKGEGFNKQKVLYCFGEAVIERQNIRYAEIFPLSPLWYFIVYDLRGEEEGEGGVEEEELYFLQLAQMVVILVSLMSVWVTWQKVLRLNTQCCDEHD